MRTTTARIAAIVLAATLLAAACSSSDTGTEGTTPGTADPSPSTTAGAEPGATAPPAPSGLGPVSFTDVTEAAGLSFVYATPFDEEQYTSLMATAKMRGGGTVADFNRDGWQDIFLVGGGLEDDVLFLNRGDGTFEDITERAGLLGDRHLGSSATVGDFDADGWIDLFVTSHGEPDAPQPGYHRLYRNNGDLTFTEMAQQAGVTTTSATDADGFGSVFADYDLDGDLDLFVAGWVKNSAGNRLFRNNGDSTFTDVTDEANIVDDGIRGFSPCLVDTDGDRYPELLLVADFGTSRYFVNNGDGTFSEFTQLSSTGQEWSGMGTAVGDVDNDGMIDWYATAIFDNTGAGRGLGNMLYLNQGNHEFDEVGAAAGVDDGGWGWGAITVDLDHDGWLDIVETNGWHFEDYPTYTNTMARLWISNGDGTYTDWAADAGFNHTLMGLGMMNLDYDNDGDQDIAITAANDEFRLYRNEHSGSGSWLRVALDPAGTAGIPPDGIGSRVWATVGDQTYLRYVGGCANYLTLSELPAHFGLGEAEMVDELRIEWPNGTETVLADVVVNQTITVTP